MKRRRQSRTYIVNTLALALMGAEANLHIIQTQLDVNVYMWAAFVLPIVNLVLREFTGTPISAAGYRRAYREDTAQDPADDGTARPSGDV